MSDLASLLLRSLLTSIVGMLVVVGAANAHSSRHAESDQRADHVTTESFAETRSPLPGACVVKGATNFSVALLQSKPATVAESDANEDGESDLVFSSGCCAVACHAAIADAGLAFFVAFRLVSFDPLMSSTALHGRAVGPGERPPRST